MYDLVCWGKQTEIFYGNTIPRNLSGTLRKLFRIDELLCCFDVKVLVCKAKNVQVLLAKNDERTMNDERRTTKWSEFSRFDWYEFRSIGPNDWSEFRTIGPNPERLVRIPNNWSEFRTNSEQMTSLTSVSSKTKKTVESVELLCCSDVEVLVCKAIWKCSSVDGRKKIGVDWPRQSQFQKICQTVNGSKLKNRRGLV